ncbi:hypothetical protein G9463_11015 [Haloarcula sp. JP-Z28]|uniref:hypothetical protein n=1 Tax=Haloarcula sp. JP-Z28 TaxID=2716715 RepID=UPI0014049F68|nr:hypothetical protein [Haloarcula sp. JP-Z28]NHN63824.1 hypothetical protein [Haloarcula sp. JP-Z28]
MTDPMAAVKDSLGRWYTEPGTVSRLAELLVRGSVAGVAGFGVAIGLKATLGTEFLAGMGIAVPAICALKVALPEDYRGVDADD